VSDIRRIEKEAESFGVPRELLQKGHGNKSLVRNVAMPLASS
jgi:hypothetical protein